MPTSPEPDAAKVLWLLLRSGTLRPVRRGSLIAGDVHELPPVVRLLLPPEDRFLSLLSPGTQATAVEALRAELAALLADRERDNWLVVEGGFRIEVRLAEGDATPRAQADYDDPEEAAADAVGAGGAPDQASGEPVVRVRLEGTRTFLRRGEGLVSVAAPRGVRPAPELSVLEASEVGATVAWLYAAGPLEVRTADGYEASYPPFSRVPVTHDLAFRLAPRPLRFWLRAATGSVEILGVSRRSRPPLSLRSAGGQTVRWDRNQEPTLSLGPEGPLPLGETRLLLRSLEGDRIAVAQTAGPPVVLRWAGGLLALAPGEEVFVLGTHLSGVEVAGADPVEVEPVGATPSGPPVIRTLRGRLPVRQDARPSGLFGFERPLARVYQDGVALEEAPGAEVSVPVHSRDLAEPLAEVAFDGCPGAKVRVLHQAFRVTPDGPARRVWGYVPEVLRFELPRLRGRIETVGAGRLVLDEPVEVRTLTGDPDDAWSVRGWTLRATTRAIEIEGPGWAPLLADGRPVQGGHHHSDRGTLQVEVAGGIYRVERRLSE